MSSSTPKIECLHYLVILVNALDFNFEKAVEGSILIAGKKVESENLNVRIRAIN